MSRHMQQRGVQGARLLSQCQLPAKQDTASTGRAGCASPESCWHAEWTPGNVTSSHSDRDVAGLHEELSSWCQRLTLVTIAWWPELTWRPGALRQGSKLQSAPPLCGPAAPGPACQQPRLPCCAVIVPAYSCRQGSPAGQPVQLICPGIVCLSCEVMPVASKATSSAQERLVFLL